MIGRMQSETLSADPRDWLSAAVGGGQGGNKADSQEAKASQLKPPLVSVVITNFNYGRFLGAAIASVRAQTYPDIECIVVDDHSTDESAVVLEQAKRAWPSLDVHRLPVNSGQSAAILKGLALANGNYVLLLDADDILFPECVATHLSAHMSSRRAVGFSCCDAVQIVGERMVIARNGNISNSFMRLPFDPSLVSSTALLPLANCGLQLPEIAAETVRHVPVTEAGWPWSTTSSMFFRKEALDLVIGAASLKNLRIATDNYLAHSINQLTGSLLLDAQLVGYRLHGSNGFNKRPALDNFLCHDKADEHFHLTCRVILDDLIVRFAHFAAYMDDPDRLFQICRRIDVPDLEPGLPSWAARSRFARLLVEHRKSLEAQVGTAKMEAVLRANVPHWRWWKRDPPRQLHGHRQAETR